MVLGSGRDTSTCSVQTRGTRTSLIGNSSKQVGLSAGHFLGAAG